MPSITYPKAPRASQDHWCMVVPVISTGHITAEDAQQLDHDAASGHPSPVMGALCNECGWLLSIDDDLVEIPDQWPGYSPQFHHVIKTFHTLGYQYLRLDSEGDTVPGLPEFEW